MIPVETMYAPIYWAGPAQLFYRSCIRILRSISRLASRSAKALRLSYSFLPLATANSSFTLPSFRYNCRGIRL